MTPYLDDGDLRVYLGHVLDVLAQMPDASVDCIVTSPPYFGLRDYGLDPVIWPDGWEGQHGLEPTVAMYVEHQRIVWAELRRVLAPHLMRWLVRLVTPAGGLILDPFLGSGTTAIAAQAEGFRCIGIEREAEYVARAIERIRRRLDPAAAKSLERDREPDPGRLSLFEVPVVAPPVPPAEAGDLANGRDGEASAERRYTDRGGTSFAPLPGTRRRD